MRDRRQGKFPPRPDGGPERRRDYRREVDVENQTIADKAADGVKFIDRVKRSGEMIAIAAVMGALIGGTTAALGVRISGPRQDIAEVAKAVEANGVSDRADRQQIELMRKTLDSLITITTLTNSEMRQLKNLGCAIAATSTGVFVAGGCK